VGLDTNYKETSFWLDPPLLSKPFTANLLPAKTDVLVIGGGYSVTTAAIRLRQAGGQVAMIDREKLGTTASARNGGMTLTSLSAGSATI
jgi:ribulose 1,5-bisphosphate synthetase/thiazole synthase